MVCTIDLAASLAALVNQPLPQEACIDSQNVLGALVGEPGATGRDHLVQQDNGTSGTFGLRVVSADGDWKLHRSDKKTVRNVIVEQELANTKVPQFQLFDLSNDPGEAINVIGKHPEIAEKMKQRLEKIIQDGRSR